MTSIGMHIRNRLDNPHAARQGRRLFDVCKDVNRCLSHVAVIGVWIAFALSSNRCRAGETTVVGPWSDPNRLEISGAIQIKPTSIVAALNSDVELQLAASPQAAYLDYFIALRRRISVIYQSRGFADVRVDCGPDSFKSKVVVRIVEGPCYVHGAIRVEGAKRIPFAEVVKQLREPSPPANASIESFDQVEGKRVPRWIGKDGSAVSLDDPVWAKGEATSFTAAGKTECIRKLTRYLADLGFPAAKFDVEIAADSATHTAALIVRLTDEGPEPVVKRIRVIGSKRNSDQAIIDYLGIRLGTHWSGAKAADWRYRLWRSGRFVRANIAATPCDDGADGLTLRIDVVELAVAPPIDEPLSAEETAMLKCRDWLAGFPERDEDAVIEFPPTSDLRKSTLVISHSGILFYRIDAAPKPGSAPLVHDAIVLTDRKLGWYALDRQLKFVAPLACKSRLIFDVGLDVIDEPKQRPKVAAGLGFTPTGQANFRSPVQLIIGGLPAAFLRRAHEIGVEFSLSDGVLTLTQGAHDRWRIDTATGRLLSAVQSYGDGASASLSFQKGRYEAECKQIETTAARFPNIFDRKRSVSSAAADVDGKRVVWRSGWRSGRQPENTCSLEKVACRRCAEAGQRLGCRGNLGSFPCKFH